MTGKLKLRWGLSPRGRGNHLKSPFPLRGKGSIPAWAGEPLAGAPIRECEGVYPRVGGGTELVPDHFIRWMGLSPRGRGNPRHNGIQSLMPGSIPAWAGEPILNAGPRNRFTVYPRVGGGTLPSLAFISSASGLSPRGRGNLCGLRDGLIVNGSIPAWAGEPPGPLRGPAGRRVYPRVGGGTEAPDVVGEGDYSLSPRGRGNPSGRGGEQTRLESIPAWAGEPLGVEYWQVSIISPADYRYLTKYTPSASTICFGDSPSVLISCSLTADGSLHVITIEPWPN